MRIAGTMPWSAQGELKEDLLEMEQSCQVGWVDDHVIWVGSGILVVETDGNIHQLLESGERSMEPEQEYKTLPVSCSSTE